MKHVMTWSVLLLSAIISPAVEFPFSSYVGGNSSEQVLDVVADHQGNTYLCGETFSTDFPLTNAFRTTVDNSESFVMKVSPAGSLLFSTFLGGGGSDVARGLAVDAASNIYVTGSCGSGFNFPFTNGFQSAPNAAGTYAFITKFGPSGSNLVYSSYFGSTNGSTLGKAVAVDSAGNAYVLGETTNLNFGVLNALQATNGGGRDLFVAKVSASGSNLLFATYLGGSGHEFAGGIALDAATNIYVVGTSFSTNFPVTNAFRSAKEGTTDGVVAKLDPAGTSLLYATYFGGSVEEYLTGCAMDPQSNLIVSGYGQSPDLPVTNAIQQTFGGFTWDAYLFGLQPNGTQLVFCTYFGGPTTDYGYGVEVDGAGNILLGGATEDGGIPVTGTPAAPVGGFSDAFVLKLLAGGQRVLYAFNFGGDAIDRALAIAGDPYGTAHVAGDTLSGAGFPLVRPLLATNADQQAGFLTRIQNEPVMLHVSNRATGVIAGWNTYSGLVYVAQTTTNLVGGAWSDATLPVRAAVGGCCASVTDAVAGVRFYRADTLPFACTQNFASCTGAFQDETDPGSNRIVRFGGSVGFAYAPKCLRIRVGQTVHFQGLAGSSITANHPLTWSCQQGAVTTNLAPAGTNGVFTFTRAGYYQYFCSFHGNAGGDGMAGNIEVVP